MQGSQRYKDLKRSRLSYDEWKRIKSKKQRGKKVSTEAYHAGCNECKSDRI